jgi:hypothetical protein
MFKKKRNNSIDSFSAKSKSKSPDEQHSTRLFLCSFAGSLECHSEMSLVYYYFNSVQANSGQIKSTDLSGYIQ